MSLHFDAAEIERLASRLKKDADNQQRAFFALVDGIVRINREQRTAKNYAASDELRTLLEHAGVQTVYSESGDTWAFTRPTIWSPTP